MGQMCRTLLVIFLLAFVSIAQANLTQPTNSSTTCDVESFILPGSQEEQEVISHLVSKVRHCIDESLPDHGMLVQIQGFEDDEEASNNSAGLDLEKRLFKSIRAIRKGWKSLPFDQRIGVVSAVAGTIAVPMYLMSTGVGYDEYQIGNVKDHLIKKTSNNATLSEAPIALTPPPPIVAPVASVSRHGKRSIVEKVTDYIRIVRRNPPKAELPGKELASDTPTKDGKEAEAKKEKESNATVARAIAMFGAANSLLYIPAAIVTALRTVAVRDSDTTTYKRSLASEDLKGFTVTCHPIQKVGQDDYQIPARAAVYKTYSKRAVIPVHPMEGEEEERLAKLAESSGVEDLKVEEINETLENIHRNETLSEMEEKQKEDNTFTSKLPISDDNLQLQRRAPQQQTPRGGGPHKGPPGGPESPNGGPGGGPHGGPIIEESIKHIYQVDDRNRAAAMGQAQPAGMSKAMMAAIGLGGAALGYGALNWYQQSQAPPPQQAQQMTPQMAQMIAQQRLAAQYAQQYPQQYSQYSQMASRGYPTKGSSAYDDYDPYDDQVGGEYDDLDDDQYAAILAAALKEASPKTSNAKKLTNATTPPATTTAATTPASPATPAAVTEIPAVVAPASVQPAQVVAPVVASPQVAPATQAPASAPIVSSNANVVQPATPALTINTNSTTIAPTRRSILADLSGESLLKRNNGGKPHPKVVPELDPFIVKTQTEIHHHNTPFELIPGFEKGYAKKAPREPAGPPGSPEQVAQELAEKKEQEELAKGQKTPWGKIAAITAGGIIVGGLANSYFNPPAQPAPMLQQGYYVDQGGYGYDYKKREVSTNDDGEMNFVKRSPETYDEIIRSLKDEARREEEEEAKSLSTARRRGTDRIEYDSDANGQHFAVNKRKSGDAAVPYDEEEDDDEYLYRRDTSNIEYDADASSQHFAVSRKDGKKAQETTDVKVAYDDEEGEEELRRRENPSIEYDADGENQHFAVYQNQKESVTSDESDVWQRRGDSTIEYNADGDEQHFSAYIPQEESATNEIEGDDENYEVEGDIDLSRREDSKIEYDADATSQHFRASKNNVDEDEDGEILERRGDASISLDNDENGSHFKAVLPSISRTDIESESVEKREEGNSVDYHVGKDKDVTFIAKAHLDAKAEVEEEKSDEELRRRNQASINLDTEKDGSSHFRATVPEKVSGEQLDEEEVAKREEAELTYHSDEEHGTDFHATTKHPQASKCDIDQTININTQYGNIGKVTIEIDPQGGSNDCDSRQKQCCYTPDR